MAIQSLVLDPNAAAYTDDEIVGKVNAATANITRAGSVAAAARPLAAGEVDNTALAADVAKANLDAMTDITRGYVSTAPAAGEYRVISIQRLVNGKLDVTYDDVAV